VAKGLALAALAGLALAAPAAQAGNGLRFDRVPAGPLPETVAFDVGAMQAPGTRATGPLSPFTINHMFPAGIDVGGEDATAAVGLSPLLAFPGYERLEDAPVPAEPGLYIHTSDEPDRAGAQMHFLAHEAAVTGQVRFATRSVSAVPAEGVVWERTVTDSGLAEFSFTLAAGAELVFDVANVDLPVFVEDVDQPAFLGPGAIPSRGPRFTIELRDRHSYSSADFDADGDRDLFIAGGGYGGAIDRYPEWAHDELLIDGGSAFRPGVAPPKAICRGRASAAPDANRDGLADIFVDCEEASPRLHINGAAGKYWKTRVLDVDGTGFRWANVDSDRPVELLAFGDEAMTVYERGTVRDYSVPLRGAPSGTPAVGDLLGTGAPQIYVPSPGGSTLIDGHRSLDPRKLGLPGRSAAVAIADVDNDGARDVHLAPQGVYRQKSRRFEKTGLLRVTAPYVALNWADLDADGRRDLLALSGKAPFAPAKRILRSRNRTKAGNWLAVDSPGLMLGDRIEVQAGGERQVGWVGESEGSRWSDTHRRVYFGVGDARRARVTIRPAKGERIQRRTRTNRVVTPT
jgi:hypothetical protein